MLLCIVFNILTVFCFAYEAAMPDFFLKLFDRINKANIPQRDRFILMLLLVSVVLLKGYTELTLVKTTLPTLIEILKKAFGL